MKFSDAFNKGIPVELNVPLTIFSGDIVNYATDKKAVEEEIVENFRDKYNYIFDEIIKDEARLIQLGCVYTTKFNKEKKLNEIIYSGKSLIYTMYKNLNINKDLITLDDINKKIDQLSRITYEAKLEKKFPILYKMFIDEQEIYQYVKENLEKVGNDMSILKKAYVGTIKDEKIKNKYLEDSLKMNNVKHFVKIYSNIFKNIIDNKDKINDYFESFTLEYLDNFEFDIKSLEANIALEYIKQINVEETLEEKQKYLYYLTSYFNDNKDLLNKNIIFEINKENISLDQLYDMYVETLINNPGLRTVCYNKEDFNNMTYDEVEEFLKKENESAKANWKFLENTNDVDRASRAIHNSIKNIKSEEEKLIEKERLKSIYLRKKEVFDKEKNYKMVEGKNSFDGYVAYIYPNGKVILEKFYDKRKNNEEVLSSGNAIYVMDIEEFYSLTNVSKTDIIEGKLCQRIIHKGEWEEKVLDVIKSDGKSPEEEYKKLVLTNKIVDKEN